MKTILTQEEVEIPTGVSIEFKSREITVKGPKGTLKRQFRHCPFDIQRGQNKKGANCLRLQMWFAKRKQKACVSTVTSHIKNMINGVIKGYRYKLRFAYAHFPINALINKEGTTVEIKNFLGEKISRKINLHPGVKATKREDLKDELVLEGNDLNNVSLSAALIHQCVQVKDKDIRKFLDGIYVSEKGAQE